MFDKYKIREFQPSHEIKNTYVLRLLNTVGTVEDYSTKIYKFPNLKLIEYVFENNGVIVGYTLSTELEVMCTEWLVQVKPKIPFDPTMRTTNKILFDNEQLKVSIHLQKNKNNMGYILVPFKEKI